MHNARQAQTTSHTGKLTEQSPQAPWQPNRTTQRASEQKLARQEARRGQKPRRTQNTNVTRTQGGKKERGKKRRMKEGRSEKVQKHSYKLHIVWRTAANTKRKNTGKAGNIALAHARGEDRGRSSGRIYIYLSLSPLVPPPGPSHPFE